MTPNALRLDAYRAPIALNSPPRPLAPPAPAEELPILTRAALRLLADGPAALRLGLTAKDMEQADETRARLLLRTVLTVRAPGPLPVPFDIALLLDALDSGPYDAWAPSTR